MNKNKAELIKLCKKCYNDKCKCRECKGIKDLCHAKLNYGICNFGTSNKCKGFMNNPCL